MWSNPQETVDLVPYTEEILKGKLHFLCGMVLPWMFDLWELYSEPCQISKMEYFVKIVNDLRFWIPVCYGWRFCVLYTVGYTSN